MNEMKQLAIRLSQGIHFTCTHGGSALRYEIPSEWQQLAAAFLDLVDCPVAREDDQTPPDEEWAKSVGAKLYNVGQWTLHASGVDLTFSRKELYVEGSFARRNPTRGLIRRLIWALGSSLGEKAAERIPERQTQFSSLLTGLKQNGRYQRKD